MEERSIYNSKKKNKQTNSTIGLNSKLILILNSKKLHIKKKNYCINDGSHFFLEIKKEYAKIIYFNTVSIMKL